MYLTEFSHHILTPPGKSNFKSLKTFVAAMTFGCYRSEYNSINKIYFLCYVLNVQVMVL